MGYRLYFDGLLSTQFNFLNCTEPLQVKKDRESDRKRDKEGKWGRGGAGYCQCTRAIIISGELWVLSPIILPRASTIQLEEAYLTPRSRVHTLDKNLMPQKCQNVISVMHTFNLYFFLIDFLVFDTYDL